MKKSILKAITFCLILVLVLGYIDKVLMVKFTDGIGQMTEFYDLEEDSIDVIILGSSQAFCNINPITLWDEYGFTSYIMGGSLQPMWNSYYYLIEALKTQKPKLILLEAYTTTYWDEYGEDARIINNTYGMKWSLNKIQAIMTSSPKERWAEFLLTNTQYHTRYSEITADDFGDLGGYKTGLWKGYMGFSEVKPAVAVDVTSVTKRRPMLEKTEKYYRKIIELAQAEEIDICIVKTPYAGISEENQEIYNTAADIASEYNVEFINYNLKLDEMDFSFAYDVADLSHCNYSGAQAVSRELGKDLKERFDLPDHRGNIAYQSWEDENQRFKELLVKELAK